jgi:hypothetical protein
MKPRPQLPFWVLSLVVVAIARDTPVILGRNGVTLPPPPTEAKRVTDTVNGGSVADPCLWLQDGKSPETHA